MQQMDCINQQQARERDCKLTKRSQAERLTIADSLIASVWKEYLNGSIDRSTLKLAAYIQTNVNRIVWKLNELNNPNTPNTLKSLDCISRQAAIEAINTWDKFGVDERGRLVRWHEGLEPYVHLRDVLTAIVNLPSAQPETYKEKLNEIASALSEKFAYMNTCSNERDIILGYLGVKRRCNTHCNTDCTNTKCESHPLSSAQPEIIMCKDCKWYGRADKRRFYRGMDCLQKRIDTIVPDKDFCSKAERRTDE